MNLAKNLVLWPIEKLKPYDRNARTHSDAQVEQIAASIAEFGFTNPILVDTDQGIIAGHGRLMAAKRLGLEQVPVIVLDHLTEAQRRAYIIADNKLAMNAGWDEDALAEEMRSLTESDFDLTLTGFSPEELDAILKDADGSDDSHEDEPHQGSYHEQYAVLVVCKSSAEQEEIYETLKGEGYTCKVVVT